MSTDQTNKEVLITNEFKTDDLVKKFIERGHETQAAIDKVINNQQPTERPEMRTGPSPGESKKTVEIDLEFKIGRENGKVHIDFKNPITDIFLTGNQAIEFGNAVVKHGRKLNKGK